MTKEWPNKTKDMYIAEQIMEKYAHQQDSETLGLFEVVVDIKQKQLNFRLSKWVVAIAQHFSSLYGSEEGEFVTRKIVSSCLTNGQTLH
jgi:hypothetical protein